MSYSIIIPSRSLSNLEACMRAIRQNKTRARVIVIWDDPGGEHALDKMAGSFDPRTELHSGTKPFIFARAINEGIAAAGADDVILLNDDALLITLGGFDLLAYAGRERKEFGVISAVIMGAAAAPEQVATMSNIAAGRTAPGRSTFAISHHMLAFMAVYIRRDVIEAVGPLDERFTAYGYDDDDYSLRVRKAGYKLGVEYSCVVEHGSLPSTYRGKGRPAGFDMLAKNRKKFIEKWGGIPSEVS